MAKLLKTIQDALRRRSKPPYQKLIGGFRKRHQLSDAAAEKAATIYLRFIAEQIEAKGRVVLLDEDMLAALAAGGPMDVDEKKFSELLESNLVQKAVDEVSKRRGK